MNRQSVPPLRQRRRRRAHEPLHDAGNRPRGGARGLLGRRALPGAGAIQRRRLKEREDRLLLLPPRLHRSRTGKAWKIGDASARAGEAESGVSLGMGGEGDGRARRGEGGVFVWGNFSSGKFGSWKRQAAGSESGGDGSTFTLFIPIYVFQIRNEKRLHRAPLVNN